MAARASWKGHLKLGEISCGVALYAARTSSDRVSFNIINRKTGNRVERQYIDSETGEAVERDQQVKGYKLSDHEYVVVGDEELARLMPDSDKVLALKGYIGCDDVDKLYFDRSYHIAPAEPADEDVLGFLASSLAANKVAALVEAVLFRRHRVVLIRAGDGILTATSLNFDYEVRSQTSAFKNIPDIRFDDELLELAGHIIDKRSGKFDPADYDDRYDQALADLIQAKIEGKTIEKRPSPKPDNVIDLRQALELSVKQSGKGGKTGSAPTKRKKAG